MTDKLTRGYFYLAIEDYVVVEKYDSNIEEPNNSCEFY